MLPGAVHEKSVFDGLGALRHHLPYQVLAAAVIRRLERRDIQHTQQVALRVEDGRSRTRQADKRCAKVITLVHRHRCFTGQHRGHAAGAFLGFRPAGAQVKAGLAAVGANARIDTVIDGLALGVGEHHAVVGMAHAMVQLCDFFAGDAHEQLGALAALLEQGFAEDTWTLQGAGVQAVLLHGPPPRIEDQRRHGRLGQALGIADHATDTVDMLPGVHGEHKASGSQALLLCASLSAHVRRRTRAP